MKGGGVSCSLVTAVIGTGPSARPLPVHELQVQSVQASKGASRSGSPPVAATRSAENRSLPPPLFVGAVVWNRGTGEAVRASSLPAARRAWPGACKASVTAGGWNPQLDSGASPLTGRRLASGCTGPSICCRGQRRRSQHRGVPPLRCIGTA